MNRNIIIGATSVLMLGLSWACKDSFLKEAPYGAVNQTTLTQSLTGADALLIAAYSNMDGFSSWDNGTPWGSAASNWVWGSIKGGDAYKGSEANDQPDIVPLERHADTPLNPYVYAKFATYYDGIARCNQAIKALKAISGSDVVRNVRIAEARFLRGFYHLELKKIYNMVPYIDETVTVFQQPNDKDIMPQIQADLQFAAANLPLTQTEVGRATKGAAQAYLGNTYLWQQKWADAKAQFDAVIASGRYKLNAKYQDNFNAALNNSPESILEVQQAVNVGTTDQGNNGDVLNFPYGGGPGTCCGFHQPSQNLVNAFKVDANGLPLISTYNNADVKSDQGIGADQPYTPDGTIALDPRLDWTVGRRGIPYLDWGNHPGSSWIRSQTYAGPYSPKKNVYYQSQQGTLSSASGWTNGYNANNVKLMRYADMLLQAAEAEVELGNLERARTYVNQIRQRAANPDGMVKKYVNDADPSKGFSTVNAANYQVGLYTTPWTSQSAARDAVRFERRIELGMEGHRFFDLVRWGIADVVLNEYLRVEQTKRTYLAGAVFVKGKSEYRPIPTQAINQSALDGKATLVQNPGY